MTTTVEEPVAESTEVGVLREQIITQVRAVTWELEMLRTQVRDKILDLKDSYDWCNEGTNDTLEVLGLPPLDLDRAYDTTVTVTFGVSVTTSDEEAAAEIAASMVKDDFLTREGRLYMVDCEVTDVYEA